MHMPVKIYDARPIYPKGAAEKKVQGIVVLEATITKAGLVTDVRVRQSVPGLGAAALAAVRQWRYTPSLLNGEPVEVLMTVTVRFALQ